jgi:hypothetical protein
MTKKKTVVDQTDGEFITVMKYDEMVDDTYPVQVKKEPLSACELCACAGCLSDKCCEHLAYWTSESGKPARYQIDDLVHHIKILEKIIAKLDQQRRVSIRAIDSSLEGDDYSKAHNYISKEAALLLTLSSSLKSDPAETDRIFARKTYLCSACSCQKCLEALVKTDREKLGLEFIPNKQCCGHKSANLSDLPF